MNKPRSLKHLLLLSIVPVLLIGSAIDMLGTAALLNRQAQTAYDRALAGVLRAISASISTESGGLALVQPWQLVNFFEFAASGNVYYRVATEDGLAEIGHAALPLPEAVLATDALQFLDAIYLGNEPVRVAVMARMLDPPLHQEPGKSQRVIIQVAESLEPRRAYTRRILFQSLWHGMVVIALTAAWMVYVIVLALKPLQRLCIDLERRAPDDLRPIPMHGLPLEVLPLVQASNDHMQRAARQARQQRQFLDDASHQLRTPLALLRTQIAHAQRESELAEIHHTLAAMQTGLERATRVTNQMLALARARGARMPEALPARERFCLNSLLEDTACMLAQAARERQHDYGLDVPPQRIYAQGWRLLLQEALINLLDNAIHYCPPGSTITLALQMRASTLVIAVQDNGAGMSEADRQQAGARFRRGAAGKTQAGAGLGLAIVQTIVQLHQGQMRLHSQENPSGLTVELVFSLESSFFLDSTPS